MANVRPIINLHQARSSRGGAATALAEDLQAKPAAAGPPAENRQLGFLIERFLAHHRRKNRSPQTIKWHRDSLADFEAFFVRHELPTEVDQDPKAILSFARAWLDDLYQRTNAFGR